MKIPNKYKEAEKQAKEFAKKHGGDPKKFLEQHIKAHEKMEKKMKKNNTRLTGDNGKPLRSVEYRGESCNYMGIFKNLKDALFGDGFIDKDREDWKKELGDIFGTNG